MVCADVPRVDADARLMIAVAGIAMI
jgi:hypothetical protein